MKQQRGYPRVTVTPKAERGLAGGHPWVYDTEVADAQPAAANSLQRERLPGAAVYEGYEALLEDPAVDAVHICTPNHSHCEIAVKALEAGKHVMCEKPMAETYADHILDFIEKK